MYAREPRHHAMRPPLPPQVYLTHYTRHSTSAKRLDDTLTWLSQYNVKPALIKDFDREEMKDEHVTCFNPSTQTEKYSPCPAQKVQVGAISLAIKHFKAFFDMVQVRPLPMGRMWEHMRAMSLAGAGACARQRTRPVGMQGMRCTPRHCVGTRDCTCLPT